MRYLLVVIVLFSSISCEKDTEGYALTGDLKNIEDGKMVYISQLDENNQPKKIDSVTVKDEKFSIDLPETENSNLSFLTVQDVNGNVMFISENETIHFNIHKDSLQTSNVRGGKENKVFYDYLEHIKTLNQKVMRIRSELQTQLTSTRDSATIVNLQQEEEALRNSDMAYKKKMISENPDAFVSVLILTDMQSMGAPASEVKEYYEALGEDVKKSSIAKSLKTDLDKRSATEIGSKAPTFSGPNPQGEELALPDLMGKVTLIDFWAAWCKPCRDENPNIVKVYNKYHDKGFNAIGISLDRPGQKDRWIKAIEDDNLTWPQISSLQFWQDPIAQQYGIKAIPAAFLLDENGVIVAKNLRGQELEDKVKELLE